MGRWAMAGLVAGHTGPSGGQYARVRNRGGAASARSLSGRRAHGSVARLVPQPSLTDSSATVHVAGVVLGLGSLGAGGDRRLAVALVGYRCLTCLFNGCLTIL